jgi:hypothetical protein
MNTTNNQDPHGQGGGKLGAQTRFAIAAAIIEPSSLGSHFANDQFGSSINPGGIQMSNLDCAYDGLQCLRLRTRFKFQSWSCYYTLA